MSISSSISTKFPLAMFYRPRYPDGELISLPWPIALYRTINHISWPLEDGVSKCTKYFDKVVIWIGFILFLQHSDADLRYLRWNMHNIDEMLTGMPTYLILVEVQIRLFHLAVQKERFKVLMQKFFAEIYIDASDEPQLYRQIRWRLLLTYINTIGYIVTVLKYLLVPVQDVLYDQKDMLHKTIYLFDYTPNPIFYPLLAANTWCALQVITTMFGETNVIANMMMHMNARYDMLRRDVHQAAAELLRRGNNSATIAREYNQVLVKIIKRNIALNEFGEQAEAQFTFRIFVMYAFSAILLCALCFKAYTHPTSNWQYVFWFVAKTMELLAIGMLGSILHKTTYDVSSMYYESNWEQIIQHSSNTAENVRLMRLIVLAIEVNSKPFCFTGQKFFRVIMPTTVKILRGAFSYFTFLMSLRATET